MNNRVTSNISTFSLVIFILTTQLTSASSNRWSVEKANKWYEDTGVIVGCNFIPRTATNTTEMWQAATFRPDIIDQELGWAAKVGFNSVRVFIQYLVWEDDPDGLRERLGKFLDITDKHNITTMFVLFDDCAFGTKFDPYLGKQGDPKPGEYAPFWTPSPGVSRVRLLYPLMG